MAPFETSMMESEVQERLFKALSLCLPEEGMGLILTDPNSVSWVSDPGGYAGLIQDTAILDDMISRIDDGDEPAMTHVEDIFLVGVHLCTLCRDYGYAVLVFSLQNRDSFMQNWNLVECVLNQMQCIAGLIEVQDYQIAQ